MVINKVLIIIDNTKDTGTLAFILGKYLYDLLLEKKIHAEIQSVSNLISQKEAGVSIINSYDSIVFSCSLSMDALPSDVIELMEIIWKGKEQMADNKSTAFIISTRFPQSNQTDIAVRIMRCFSEKMGYRWLGALQIGQAQALENKDMVKLKRKSRHIIEALRIMAEDICKNQPLSRKIYQLMNKRIMSVSSYLSFMNKQMKKTAKKYGTLKTIKSRYYN